MSSAELSLTRVRRPRAGRRRDALWTDRTLVKTWAMRGTLHLVAASELPELVRARHRLAWLEPVWLRYFGVTAAQMIALQDGIGDMLSDEPMTAPGAGGRARRELGDPAFAERVTSQLGHVPQARREPRAAGFGPDAAAT